MTPLTFIAGALSQNEGRLTRLKPLAHDAGDLFIDDDIGRKMRVS
ncbi:hypothetical protein [Stieleria varia]